MHPAYSVIFFTTASGAGYGLLFWLSIARLSGWLAHDSWLFFLALCIALVLITAGLLSSTAHLGRPERAWRAFSQWRTSWLSREGVVAVATYGPAGLLALLSLLGVGHAWSVPVAALAALGAVATVYCTGMIYASLRTVRQWNLGLVPASYLALSAASGALLLAVLLAASGRPASAALGLALIGHAVALAIKLAYYRAIDTDGGRFTAQMALGIGNRSIRQLDPPHTRPNFVMREMGYAVARRHARRLRLLVLLTLFALPALLATASLALPGVAMFFLIPAIVSAGFGLVVERWLFFAEASHVSMLYYGQQRA